MIYPQYSSPPTFTLRISKGGCVEGSSYGANRSSEGGSVLEKCPSFLEICKVFKALACPDDTVALAAALKGECFGIDEKGIETLRFCKEANGNGLAKKRFALALRGIEVLRNCEAVE